MVVVMAAVMVVTDMVITEMLVTVMELITMVVVVENTAAVETKADMMPDTITVDTKVLMITVMSFTKNGESAAVTKVDVAAIMEVKIADTIHTNTKVATVVTMVIMALITGMKTTTPVVAVMAAEWAADMAVIKRFV